MIRSTFEIRGILEGAIDQLRKNPLVPFTEWQATVLLGGILSRSEVGLVVSREWLAENTGSVWWFADFYFKADQAERHCFESYNFLWVSEDVNSEDLIFTSDLVIGHFLLWLTTEMTEEDGQIHRPDSMEPEKVTEIRKEVAKGIWRAEYRG